MDRKGYAAVTPDAAGATAANPFLDLASGYVKRSMAELPKQGDQAPWRLHQNYVKDVRLLRRGPIDDAVVFTPAAAVAADRARSIASCRLVGNARSQ
jgi:monooxygenase